MSWDIYIKLESCPSCGRLEEFIEVRNLTYNNSAILNELNAHPDYIDGKYCMEVSEIAKIAYNNSYNKNDTLIKLEPPNGWGGLEDVRNFLSTLEEKCLFYPKGKVQSR